MSSIFSKKKAVFFRKYTIFVRLSVILYSLIEKHTTFKYKHQYLFCKVKPLISNKKKIHFRI